jgi:AcrR family transcriptional regulator
MSAREMTRRKAADKAASPPAPRRARMTNVERTARTRKDLLEAAINCLFRHGYGATTTHLVAEVAGLSRGAMMHHFPTKADLMEAVVRYAWEKEVAITDAALEKIEPGLPRYRALIDEHWDTVRGPENTAINEIRIGSRSDPELAAKLQPIMVDIAREYGRFVGAKIREAGLEPDEDLRGLTVTWVLGLTMMNFYWAAEPNPRMEASLLSTLKGLQEDMIQRQLSGTAST